jgi:GT2 family glycosyltransferase
MNNKKFLSAVVLGYGNFDETSKKCLASLLEQAKENTVGLLAVDNGSPDDSANKLLNFQKDHPYLEVQLNSKNLGFGGGMNQAVGQLDSEWILLVNSDIIFPPKSLLRLVSSLKKCPEQFGIVGPLTNNAGNEQCIYLPGASAEDIIQNASSIIDNPCGLFTPAYRADFCCVAIRKKLWDELEGLDRKYGKGYYEDFDFSMRAHNLGFGCAVCEDSFVYHEGSLSFKNNPTQDALIRSNKLIFLSTHPQAKLHHQRECNWSAINFYLNHLLTPEINQRLILRLKLAKKILPKSFLKKLFWSRKLKKLKKILRVIQL